MSVVNLEKEFSIFKKTINKRLIQLEKLTQLQDKEIKHLKSDSKQKDKTIQKLTNQISLLNTNLTSLQKQHISNKQSSTKSPKYSSISYPKPCSNNINNKNRRQSEPYINNNKNESLKKRINKKKNKSISDSDDIKIDLIQLNNDKFDILCQHKGNHSEIKLLNKNTKMIDVLNELDSWRVIYCEKYLSRGNHVYKFKLLKGFRFAVGICDANKTGRHKMKMPGFYSADGICYKFDGKIHIGTELGVEYAESFKEGDIIGFILNFNEKSIQFTKNDKIFGNAWKVPRGSYRACICSSYEENECELVFN